MKKNLFWVGALLVGMTIATSCSDEEVAEQVKGKKTVVTATIDNGSARTSVNSLYKVVWTQGDAFTVFGVNGSSKGDMTLQGEGGTTTGEFGGTLSPGLANGDVALFPATTTGGDDATSAPAGMTYTFPNEYTSTETDAPMLGTCNGSSFSFSPLAAFIRVNANGLQASSSHTLTITSEAEALSGTATLSEDNALIPSGDGKTITVTLTPAADGSITFDAPIPAQTYTKLTITLDDNTTPLKEKSNFEAVAGVLYEATTEVSDAASLKTALENGGNIDLTEDITITDTEDLNISNNTIIDLNGKKLNVGSNSFTVAQGKTFTIQNAASLARSTEEGPSITSSSDIIIASANSVINIGEGVSLTTTGENCCCIWVPGSDPSNIANGVTINTAGNLTATEVSPATIYVNGNVTSGTINITGGSVIHEKDVAVYIAGNADLTISEGVEIKGTTGVEIRSGSLTIEGGTITGTGNPANATPNGNGTTTVGAAVAVSKHTTNNNLTTTIKGGTFNGINALYEADLNAEDQKATNVTMSVIGGTFNGAVSSQSCTSFITGGTFSDPSACYYLGTNANVIVNIEDDYEGAGFKTQGGQTVTMTIAENKTYTVTAPLVGSPGTQTLGFQFLKDSNVKINGGTITSSNAKMLINNYANLTLSGVTLAPSIPTDDDSTTDYNEGMNGQAYYVLSNNCGTVNIEGGTTITAPKGDENQTVYAFDVCKYLSYPNVTVNVKDATITGNVEYTGEGESQELIVSESATINGDLVVKGGVGNPAITVDSAARITGNGWEVYKETEEESPTEE